MSETYMVMVLVPMALLSRPIRVANPARPRFESRDNHRAHPSATSSALRFSQAICAGTRRPAGRAGRLGRSGRPPARPQAETPGRWRRRRGRRWRVVRRVRDPPGKCAGGGPGTCRVRLSASGDGKVWAGFAGIGALIALPANAAAAARAAPARRGRRPAAAAGRAGAGTPWAELDRRAGADPRGSARRQRPGDISVTAAGSHADRAFATIWQPLPGSVHM